MPFALQVPDVDGGSQIRGMFGDFDLSGCRLGAAATGADADAANGTALPKVTLFVTDAFGQLVDTVPLSGVTIASAQEANGQAVLALHDASITTTPRRATRSQSAPPGEVSQARPRRSGR